MWAGFYGGVQEFGRLSFPFYVKKTERFNNQLGFFVYAVASFDETFPTLSLLGVFLIFGTGMK
jgi:hypothetical protein